MNPKLLIHELNTLGIAFGIDLSQERLAIYVQELQPLEDDVLRHAVTLARQTCKFFPSIAELLELAGATHPKLSELAEAKWYELRQLTGSLAYSASALEDPLVKICFHQLGGHSGFGMWDYENDEVWRKKQFCESYAALVRSKDRGILTQVDRSEAIGMLDVLSSISNDKSRPDGSVA